MAQRGGQAAQAFCCGNGEKDQIGRGVVQETGQGARRPEHLEGSADPQAGTVGFQQHQGRLHGNEDADKQHGHFLNGAPGKVIGLTYGNIGSFKGQQGGQQDNGDLDHGREGEHDLAKDMDSQDLTLCVLEHRQSGQGSAENYRSDNHDQEEQIVQAADVNLSAGLADIRFSAMGDVFAVVAHIHPIENEQQNGGVQCHYGEQPQGPEEGNAPGKSHQQRRISDGSQTAADVGDEEDEEHHDVTAALAPGVHLDDGTDHQHTGAGGADAAGHQGTQQQQSYIDPRGTGEISLQGDIARNAEQAEEQDNKGDIVADHTLQRHLSSGADPRASGIGNQKHQRPQGYHQGLVALPPVGTDDRKDGNGQQQTGKGDAHPERDCAGFTSVQKGCTQRHHNGKKGTKFFPQAKDLLNTHRKLCRMRCCLIIRESDNLFYYTPCFA